MTKTLTKPQETLNENDDFIHIVSEEAAEKIPVVALCGAECWGDEGDIELADCPMCLLLDKAYD